MNPSESAQSIKNAARAAGFDWCGICPAVPPPGLERFHQWLASGYHGEMQWLENRRTAYANPQSVLEGARSIVMLALGYSSRPAAQASAGQGRVSRYAWGTRDYHDVIHQRLRWFRESVEKILPGATVRGVVDTAPLLEREFAVLAGLGWQGKNTLVLNRNAGSWFFLAALLVDVELEYDAPNQSDHCGTCRACLDACPTDAFVAPNLLDATRCISYLTIELRGPIPVELRQPMGDWVFGCDVCQDVCPWNRRAPETGVADFHPVDELNPIELGELFSLDDEEFRTRFRKTPLWRARRRGILRNAAIVLGNQAARDSIPALTLGLNDFEPLVRGASAWALGQIDDCNSALRERLDLETENEVIEEIRDALAASSVGTPATSTSPQGRRRE